MRNPFRRSEPLAAAASIADTQRVMDRSSIMSRDISEAWEVWRLVGEIHYATTQQARLVERVRWDIFIDDEQVSEVDAQEILRAAFGNQVDSLAREQALHLQVAGGYHLVRVGSLWHVLPAPPDHKAKKIMAGASINVLNTHPDPRDPDRTDSPVLAAIDVARELILVRGQARAAARNRTAQLNTVIYPLEGAGPDPAEFEKKFVRVMTAPLENEKSSSVVIPNLIGFQGDWIEKWKLMQLTGPIDKSLNEKVPSLIRQLAVIMDHPPQLLLGMEDLNHWAAWAVQEDNWFGHVEPLAKTVGEGFALAIAQATDMDPERLQAKPDPAPLLKRRPSLEDILAAHEQQVVGGKFVRLHLGADEEDAPTEEEKAEKAASSSGGGGGGDQEPSTEQDDDSGGQPVAAAAPEPIPVDARMLGEIDVQTYDALEDLIADTAERALERLGAKVRSIGQGKDLGIPGAEVLPNAELAVRYDGVIPNSDQVIDDVVMTFVPKLTRLMDRAYSRTRETGVPVKQDEQHAEEARALFRALVTEHVNRELTGKTGIIWHASRRILSVAGGNGDIAVVAAPGVRVVNAGIALGQASLRVLRDLLGLISDSYIWYHKGGADDDHPRHVALDGRRFDGDSIFEDNILWFPGDHVGCRCIAVPDLRRVT